MKPLKPRRHSLLLTLLLLYGLEEGLSFSTCSNCRTLAREMNRNNTRIFAASTTSKSLSSRRDTLVSGTVGVVLSLLLIQPDPCFAVSATATSASLSELTGLLEEARKQLDAVPDLIDQRKWDSVRAVLIQPPLSDCWTKSSRPLLLRYAQAIGETPNGDELAALEAKEEAVTHLRFLDMAVYNNVFNPIATEGESGATKELIRSYYEDPVNEWKASKAALDELVQLGSESQYSN